jgi:putative metalloprotease
MKNLVSAIILLGLCSACTNPQSNTQYNNQSGNSTLGSAATKGIQSLMVSDVDIIGYANDYMKWMDAQNPVCKTTVNDKGMQAIANRLVKITSAIPTSLVKQLNLNILSYNVADTNAFACANGDIRVYAGLMSLMTDDQVLAVIGHEIGHIANRDSKDGFVTALRISALKDAIGAVGGKTIAKLTNSQLGDLAETLGKAHYSQKQEIDADAYGYEFLKKCGKDPANMASSLGVLLKLQQEAGTPQNTKFQNLFSSHPDLQKRIETLRRK